MKYSNVFLYATSKSLLLIIILHLHPLQGSLVCFHRGETLSIVPGCSGQGTRGIDYCIEPSPHLVSLQKVVGNGFFLYAMNALGTCQGDCNYDGDCEVRIQYLSVTTRYNIQQDTNHTIVFHTHSYISTLSSYTNNDI